MEDMDTKGFVDPQPLFEERIKEIEKQFPEPRSHADEQLLEIERRQLLRELRIARRTAMWVAPPDEA